MNTYYVVLNYNNGVNSNKLNEKVSNYFRHRTIKAENGFEAYKLLLEYKDDFKKELKNDGHNPEVLDDDYWIDIENCSEEDRIKIDEYYFS